MKTIKINHGEKEPENYTGIVEYPSGMIEYYLNGKRHREDGPAVVWDDGTIKYFINDKEITKEVKEWIIENNIPEDCKDWNKSDKILFKLTFG